MELATLKTYLSDPELPQERVYLVAIKGVDYEFTLKRKQGENPLLIIPDAGGQMDMIPVHEAQVIWLKENFKKLKGFKEVWGTVWELTTQEARTIVETRMQEQGYLSSVAFSLHPAIREEIQRILTITRQNPYNERFTLHFSELPGTPKVTVEHIEIFLSHTFSSSVFDIGCFLFNDNWNPPLAACPWLKDLKRNLIDDQGIDYHQEKTRDFEYLLDVNENGHLLEYLLTIPPEWYREIHVFLDFRIKHLLEQGSRLYQADDLKGALAVFLKANEEYPESPEVAFNCGVLADRLKDRDLAIRMQQEALKRDKHYFKALVNLAALLHETGKFDEAGILVNQGLSMLPPDWITDRLKILKDEITSYVLRKITVRHHQIAAGLISGTALEQMRRYISALAGKHCKTCDIAIMESGTIQYNLITDDDVIRVQIENNTLILRADRMPESVRSFTLPSPETNPAAAASHRNGGEMETYKREFSLDKQFLLAVYHICRELGKSPDKLFLVKHSFGEGEWEQPDNFTPDEYEKTLREVEHAHFGYQINFDLVTDEVSIYGRANPGYGRSIRVTGKSDVVDRIRRVIEV